MTADRRREHRRNQALETLLGELATALAPAEQAAAARYRMPSQPPILIVGAPRSGTTILLQWLAATGQVTYPTNLLSRFYAAPWVGAKIQQLLTDPTYDFQGELFDLKGALSFESILGKTRGAMAPNEFWYFWRRFLPNEELRHLDAGEEAAIDGAGLAAELAAWESVEGRPLALKAMIVQYNLPAIDRILERVLFVHVERALFYNAQSLLEARETYYGDRNAWYSAKPREYAALATADCFTQVVGQVHHTNAAIREGLAGIDPARALHVSYEALCHEPATVYAALCERLAAQQCEIDTDYAGPAGFDSTNTDRGDPADREALERACMTLTGADGRA